MKDYTPTYPDRKMQELWAVVNSRTVRRVQCFENTNAPNTFWVPELGYTLTLDAHLFTTRSEASMEARERAQRELKDAIEAMRYWIGNDETYDMVEGILYG